MISLIRILKTIQPHFFQIWCFFQISAALHIERSTNIPKKLRYNLCKSRKLTTDIIQGFEVTKNQLMVTWNHLWRMRPHHLLTIDHRFFHQRRKIWVHWMSRQHDCSILQQQSARRYVNTLLVLIGQNYQREENRADIWYLSISLSYYTFQKIAAVLWPGLWNLPQC